jgi:ubiquinone/menaquinone biosynthesis C-methylase UbiE
MANAYPNIKVDGYDVDADAIEAAAQNAKAAGVADRVTFLARSAYDPNLNGTYDLVTAFEMVHDLSQPVAALKTMRRFVGTRGTVLIVDERVGEEFSTKADEVERLMYGWSTVMCLPNGKDDVTSAETGTVMRPKTLKGYATEAGFGKFEILPIENYFFRLYRLQA